MRGSTAPTNCGRAVPREARWRSAGWRGATHPAVVVDGVHADVDGRPADPAERAQLREQQSRRADEAQQLDCGVHGCCGCWRRAVPRFQRPDQRMFGGRPQNFSARSAICCPPLLCRRRRERAACAQPKECILSRSVSQPVSPAPVTPLLREGAGPYGQPSSAQGAFHSAHDHRQVQIARPNAGGHAGGERREALRRR